MIPHILLLLLLVYHISTKKKHLTIYNKINENVSFHVTHLKRVYLDMLSMMPKIIIK